jgi:hypothetical protein
MPKLTDQELALAFLTGRRIVERDGHQFFRHLTNAEETKGRQALVRLLKSSPPLSAEIRWHLAALIDPKYTSRALRRGVKPNLDRDVAIASHIFKNSNDGRLTARLVKAVMRRYGVSRATVFRVRETHGQRFSLK